MKPSRYCSTYTIITSPARKLSYTKPLHHSLAGLRSWRSNLCSVRQEVQKTVCDSALSGQSSDFIALSLAKVEVAKKEKEKEN